jgi:hypothetical protein
MSSLDVRSRTDQDMRAVDVEEFFDHEFSALGEANGVLALAGAHELDVAPFSFITESGTWTLALVGSTFQVTRGEGDGPCVNLSDQEFADLVNDLLTPTTLVSSANLRMPRGGLNDLFDWWVVLRSLLDARPAHTAGSVTFRDRDGGALDVGRSFTPEDDDADIAHFLMEAGFLHLSGWFADDQMAQISADMDRALPMYVLDDGRSWWAETADGTKRAVRLQGFAEHSPTLRELLRSERFLRLGNLTDDGYVPSTDAEALEKPIGIVKGISDLVWHKDCSLGMHSYQCCGLVVGISVTGADAMSGQLGVVPGSHRALVQPSMFRKRWGLEPRQLPTRTGDVTVHCTCTLHMSHPPIERERRVLYTGFSLPPRSAGVSERLDAVWEVREQAHRRVSQPPSPVATGRA